MRLKTSIIVGFLTTVLVLTVLLVSNNQGVLFSDFDLFGLKIHTYWAFALTLLALPALLGLLRVAAV